MAIIKGKDLIIKLGGKTTYHATSHSYNADANFEEYETKDTDGKQNVLVGHSGTATADGLVNVGDAGDNALDTPAIIDAFNAGEAVDLTLVIGSATYTTQAWITSVSGTGQVGSNATYSVSLKFNKLEKAA